MKKIGGRCIKVKAFTLIELLVVIAIVALLLTIVLPGLNLAKKKGASAACLSNVRQMSTAWYIYQGENDGKIMSCRMEDVGTQSSCKEGWIGQPHRITDTTSSSLSMTSIAPSITAEDEMRGIEKGKLYPYLDSYGVYHCPADKLRTRCDKTSKMYVSYAIPNCLNNGSSNSIKKLGEITATGERFNFVEIGTYGSRNWTWNGWWSFAFSSGGPAGLHDPLAISHGNSGTFGFVDGHADIRKWADSIVLDHYKKGESMAPGDLYGVTYPTAGGRSEDIDWLAKGWAKRR